MNTKFSKYKHTTQLIYRTSSITTNVEVIDEYIRVSSQFWDYSGKYYIRTQSINNLFKLIRFEVSKDSYDSGDNCTIDIHFGGTKVKIFRQDKSGIFFKN